MIAGTRKHIAVIGGGWAGCAAAVTLTHAGHRVSLFEASRTLGGRARRIVVDGRTLDNGQHILLGAYRATLNIMKTVGIDIRQVVLRLPLQMRYAPGAGGMDFAASFLPAPWHLITALIRATGLTPDDKLALARFSTTARWMGWQLNQDCSVAELLDRFDQTERLNRLMWVPLCVAALNTPPERASAQIFLNVLRDSLGARRQASDMLIPRTDLTDLFPQQAADYITRHGAHVACGQAAIALLPGSSVAGTWQVLLKQDAAIDRTDTTEANTFDGVIIATGPETAASLLDGHCNTTALRSLTYEPITTCYLQYAPQLRLDQPFYVLADNPEQYAWGQFVFDQGRLRGQPGHAGLLTVVVSASGEAIAGGHAALAEGIIRQLSAQLRHPLLTTPDWIKVISEKRATFSCSPALARPDNTGLPIGMALAGDYVAGEYPATLESAVRSGIAAAEVLSSPAR